MTDIPRAVGYGHRAKHVLPPGMVTETINLICSSAHEINRVQKRFEAKVASYFNTLVSGSEPWIVVQHRFDEAPLRQLVQHFLQLSLIERCGLVAGRFWKTLTIVG